MKKFLSLMSIAIVVVLFASVMLLVPAAAAETEVVNSKNVVFISDAVTDLAAGMTQAQAVATYDGSSADKPLYPIPAPSYDIKEKTSDAGVVFGMYYLNTALYQAAEKLLDTGGTIVICGPVRIDDDDAYGSSLYIKDFFFPESDRRITITNKYNDIDYRDENDARLEIGGCAHISFNSPVTMENIKINCTTTGRLLCAQGNDLVMGEGITNDLPSGETTGWFYPSVVGGKRYGDLDSDTSVTIKSGSYGMVSGSSWGNNLTNPSYQKGDVNVCLLGGTFTSYICGISARLYEFNCTESTPKAYYKTTDSSVVVNGDINITIGGSAVIKSFVYAVSPARFGETGHNVYIKVLGGQFSSGTYLRKEWTAASPGTIPDGTGIMPDHIVLDMSDAATISDAVLNDMINQNKSAMQILYPAKWLQTYTVNTYPSNSTVFKGDSVTSKGASLTLNFKNLKDNATTYTQTVTYDGKIDAFKAECDTSKIGSVTTTYKYGTTTYYTQQTTVVQTPDVSILGARLRITEDSSLTNQTEQTLRFVADCTSNGVDVTDKGVLVVKAYMLSSPEKLTFEDTYGLFDCKPATGADYSIGGLIHFECDFDGINQGEFNTDYYVRAYVKYTYNGETHVKYSDVITRNPYTVALQATADGSIETEDAITYLQKNLINAFDTFSVNTLYDETAAAEFRDTVVNYAQMQATIEWTPEETFAFYNNGSDYGVVNLAIYEKGKTYYGIPYASSGWLERRTTNYEHFMSLLDNSSGKNVFPMAFGSEFGEYGEDDTLTAFVAPSKCNSRWCSYTHDDIADCIAAYTTSNYIYGYFDAHVDKTVAANNYRIFPGSHCAQVLFTGWNNIIDNKATVQRLAYTSNMVPGHNSGAIAVGDYLYKYEDVYANSSDDEVKYKSDTGKMVAVSGTAKMYAAYDKLQPGDCLIHYVYGEYKQDATYGAGHARMVLSVNPTAKTVTTLECANWNLPYVNVISGNGTSNTETDSRTSWKTLTYNYDYLIETAFVPVTIKELATGLSDKQSVILTDTNLAETLSSGTIDGLVKSNKSIDGVRILIKDASGNTVYDRMAYLLDESRHLAGYDLEELGVDFSDKLTSGVSYKFTFEVNTATSVDNIALVTDYAFTAK